MAAPREYPPPPVHPGSWAAQRPLVEETAPGPPIEGPKVLLDVNGNAIPISPAGNTSVQATAPVATEPVSPPPKHVATVRVAPPPRVDDTKSRDSENSNGPSPLQSVASLLNPNNIIKLLAEWRPEETPEEVELRRKVEKEEVKIFTNNFNQYVDELRITHPAKEGKRKKAPEYAEHPRPTEFQRDPVAAKSSQDEPDDEEEEDRKKRKKKALQKRQEQGEELTEEEEMFLNDKVVDWFAYWISKANYDFNVKMYNKPPLKFDSEPPPQFTVKRFRAAGTRLYVAARGPWESFFVMLGSVIMWDDPNVTLKWMMGYLVLMLTSTFIPFFLSVSLYKLLRPRFSSVNQVDLQKQRLTHVKHVAMGEEFITAFENGEVKDRDAMKKEQTDKEKSKDDLSDHSDSEDDSDDDNRDFSARMNDKADELASKLRKQTKAKAGEAVGKTDTGGAVGVMSAWKSFQKQHGAKIVVILNDVADMHEKVYNLFSWKRPESSVKAAIGMVFAIIGVYMTPPWVLLKLVQLGGFIVFFFVIPFVVREPYYTPKAGLFGSAPTHAEHAIHLIRKYGLEDEVGRVAQDSVTDKEKEEAIAVGMKMTEEDGQVKAEVKADTVSKKTPDERGAVDRGASYLETGRKFLTGEKSFGVAMGRNEDYSGPQHKDILAQRTMSIGSMKGGVALRTNTNDNSYTAGSTTYLAHLDGSIGTLFISKTGVRFAPFLNRGGKKQSSSQDKDPLTQDPEHPEVASAAPPGLGEPASEGEEGVIVEGKEVQIPMGEISGLKRTTKTKLGINIANGLRIDTHEKKKFNFSYVANRDEAFTRLLASSNIAFESK